jgi:hypothetical protein
MAVMRNSSIVFLGAVLLMMPGAASSQPASGSSTGREVAVSVGPAYLSHGDDPLGWGSTVGASITIPIVQRLAVRLDAQRAFGPKLEERTCASVSVSRPCTGSGHYGARDLTIWSATSVYHFRPSGVQPFVLGGLDVLHFTFLSDITFLAGDQVRITEAETRHTTMGIAVGGGVRVPVGNRFAITPELTLYDGTILAGANLTQVRTSLSFGYRW